MRQCRGRSQEVARRRSPRRCGDAAAPRSPGRARTASGRSSRAARARARCTPPDSRSQRRQPTPTPSEKTVSSSVTTCSSPPSTSCPSPGNCARTIAPKNQNHEMPRIERKTGAVLAREADRAPGLGERVPADREARDRRRARRDAPAREPARDRDADHRAPTRPSGPCPAARPARRRGSCRPGSRGRCPSRPARCRRPARPRAGAAAGCCT